MLVHTEGRWREVIGGRNEMAKKKTGSNPHKTGFTKEGHSKEGHSKELGQMESLVEKISTWF